VAGKVEKSLRNDFSVGGTMSGKVKVKVAEIETTLELFAYWLERDFPRVKELKWLELRAMDDPKANPLFERKWWAWAGHGALNLGTPSPLNLPVFTIVAETLTPGKVSTAWGLSPLGGVFKDIPHPIEAMGKWVEFRFGVVATSPEEETPANERAMLGLRPSALLTPAEKEIAEMLANGLDDEAISRARVSSRQTVETQRKSIAKKLGIKADKGTIAESLRYLGFGSV
jgi:DNA-binding CsgD family transcriptional regulator